MKTIGAIISTVAGILAFFAAIGNLLCGVGISLLGTSDSMQNILLGVGQMILCGLIIFLGSISLKSKKLYIGIFIIVCSVADGLLGGIITKIFMVFSLIGGIIAVTNVKTNN